MNIASLKISKLQLLILLLLIAGIIFGLSLVQSRQTLKSRADQQIFSSLEVSGANCDYSGEGRSDCLLDEDSSSVTIDGIQDLKEIPAP